MQQARATTSKQQENTQNLSTKTGSSSGDGILMANNSKRRSFTEALNVMID